MKPFSSVPTIVAAALAILTVPIAVPGCSAEVLKLDTATQSNALAGIDQAHTTIASLTDAQAAKVCEWLIDVYPDANAKPPHDGRGGIIPPGYVNAASIGCGRPPQPVMQVVWPLLPFDDCVLNLRHSPCEATLASLTQCASAIATHFAATMQTNSSSPCDTDLNVCEPFWTASGCRETVFQTDVKTDGVCGGSLPIAPNVTCVEPGTPPPDAGAEDAMPTPYPGDAGAE